MAQTPYLYGNSRIGELQAGGSDTSGFEQQKTARPISGRAALVATGNAIWPKWSPGKRLEISPFRAGIYTRIHWFTNFQQVLVTL